MSDTSNATSAAETARKREAASEKWYVDINGNPVDIDDPAATAMIYKDLADNATYKIEVVSREEPVRRMMAFFGASTLATNVASFNRNQAKGEEKYASDTLAVKARFERMEAGNWGLKPAASRPSIDVDVLVDIMVAKGLAPPDLAVFKAALLADPVIRAELRNHEEVAKDYDDAIRAKKAATAAPTVPLASLLAKFSAPAPSAT